MMPSKIALRLVLYFSAALLLFSVIIGGTFAALSTRHTTDLHIAQLQARAETISQTMYGFLSGTAKPMNGSHQGQGNGRSGLHGTGFGAYMRFLDQLAMADVWVVDSDSKTITPGSQHADTIEYEQLPPDGESVIEEALAGKVFISESFSGFMGERTLSVGVPIRKDDGSPVLGAVLLHSPVQGVSDTVRDGLYTLLISLLVALLLAVPAAFLLSLKFTRPLNQMRDTASRIAQGDFSAQNNLQQNDEIGALAGAMDSMALKLGEASRESQRLEHMRQDFISNISHELRTPVTVLRGSLEAIVDSVVSDPEQVSKYHHQMLEESKHMQRLVDDLLELSRLENADFKIEKSPLELHQLLEDVARSMRRVAEPKGVVLETRSVNKELPVFGDYGRLRQMLIVVVHNAIKFSPEGGTVVLSLSEQENKHIISVSDTGPGISDNELPEIFQRFHKSGRGNETGTGLGLPIASKIAQRHNIKIQIDSKPGNTVFTFIFP